MNLKHIILNNTVVFINENYIPKKQIDEKNKIINNNQQEQKKNGEDVYMEIKILLKNI